MAFLSRFRPDPEPISASQTATGRILKLPRGSTGAGQSPAKGVSGQALSEAPRLDRSPELEQLLKGKLGFTSDKGQQGIATRTNALVWLREAQQQLRRQTGRQPVFEEVQKLAFQLASKAV